MSPTANTSTQLLLVLYCPPVACVWAYVPTCASDYWQENHTSNSMYLEDTHRGREFLPSKLSPLRHTTNMAKGIQEPNNQLPTSLMCD